MDDEEGSAADRDPVRPSESPAGNVSEGQAGKTPERPARKVPEVPPDEIPESVPGESRFIETNGIRLHVVEAGPEDGKLLVLLHGFPEFWYGWHEVIRPLANAGYRVVVPDQRGYNLSAKPSGVSAYTIDELATDVVGLIDAYDRNTAAIAGHDWGAAVGWWIALHHPDRLSEFVAINVPHPTVFRERLQHSWSQRLKSWYMLPFQVPWLPEQVASVGHWAPIVRGMRTSSRPGTFSPGDFERYRRAWSRDGAFTAMLNWYRAIARDRPEPATETVTVPTLVIWGTADEFLERSMAGASVEYCADGRLHSIEDATHWVIHEEPVRVADAIAEHADDLPPGARE